MSSLDLDSYNLPITTVHFSHNQSFPATSNIFPQFNLGYLVPLNTECEKKEY